MDEPVVTAAPPPARRKSLAQQETDFTSEGSPPPGMPRPHDALQRAGTAASRRQSPAMPVPATTVVHRAAKLVPDEPAHGARRNRTSRGKPAAGSR